MGFTDFKLQNAHLKYFSGLFSKLHLQICNNFQTDPSGKSENSIKFSIGNLEKIPRKHFLIQSLRQNFSINLLFMNLFFPKLHFKKVVLFTILLFAFIGFLPTTTLAQTTAPFIESVDPKEVEDGSPAMTITINGLNFTAQSTVNTYPIIDPITVRFISPNKLEVDMPASYFTFVGGPLGNRTSIGLKVVDPALGESNMGKLIVVSSTMWSTVGKIYELLRYVFAEFPGGLFKDAIMFLADMIRDSSRIVAGYSGKLLIFIIDQLANNESWSITKEKDSTGAPTFAGSAFLIAWGEVRKWANMLVVLGLIGIAISTILRWPNDWEAKKLLPTLLIVALLINFSVVFVGLIIDASNIIMKTLLGATNVGEFSDMTLSINTAWQETRSKILMTSYSGTLEYLGISIVYAIMYTIMTVNLLWFSIIFLERYVMLAILFILSPLAFILFVFPQTKSHFKNWWERLIKWCFIGLGAAFFLNLSTNILTAFSNSNAGSGLAMGDEGITGFMKIVFRFSIVILFMLTGLKLLAKADGLAKVVMAATTAIVAAFVTGGASILGSVTGGAMKIAGNTKTGEKIKERSAGLRDKVSGGYGRLREGIGLDRQGTANMANQQRQAARMKQFEPIAEAEKDDKIVAQRATRGGAEGAAYAKELAKRKKTHRIDPVNIKGVLDNAESYGVDISEYEKGNPELAKLNVKKVTEEREKLKTTAGASKVTDYMKMNPGKTKDEAELELAQKAVKISVIKKMSASNIAGMEKVDKDVIEHSGHKKINEAMKEMSEDQTDQIRDFRAKAKLEFLALKAKNIAIAKMTTTTQAQNNEYDGNKIKMKELRKLVDKINLITK